MAVIDNLWLTCWLCNNYKGVQTHAPDPLTERKTQRYNPRKQEWSQDFTWSDDGVYITGISACGRATVSALQLNNLYAIPVRQTWISVGWHPPVN